LAGSSDKTGCGNGSASLEECISMERRHLIIAGSGTLAALGLAGWARGFSGPFAVRTAANSAGDAEGPPGGHFEVEHTPAEWRQLLGPEQYRILRDAHTEPAFTSPLNHEKRKGTFACAGCQLALFSSSTKFESGTGWPSFWQPLDNAVATTRDASFGMERTEVHCRRCGGHLGHVFDDGPPPTGLRYCMNGLALVFKPEGGQS
jgi:peptide-methionine (R)-S-oxide reductase